MKAALVGYGQMGHLLERLAPEFDIEIVEKFWDEHPFTDTEDIRKALAEVDVLIDFSVPAVAFENIQAGLALGKQIVIGTTAWFDRLEDVQKQVNSTGTGLVYASNFSLGVNLFYKLVKKSAEMISKFKEYDPMLEEKHHQFKKDAPSGTAIEIVKLMQSSYPEHEIPVTSVRGGYIPGTHTITFDSQVDNIQLSHCARSREGFARGALMAARWISGKTGVYHFSEIVDEVLK
ncbi:dihydrodipicolinate reductase [candidate division KSB1 bacterium]|nr:dihydrodipicolinate reductase [candidate division KSB1 bacterium]